MSEYTQGVCHDGAAILKDGQPVTIEEILAGLRQQDGWISVEDRLPENDDSVLACTARGEIYTCARSVITRKNARPPEYEYEVDRFTHWMPLPSPPETGEE